MKRCPTDQLEAYAAGMIEPRAEVSRVAEHLKSCPRCAREIAWLRAEKRVFEAREAELPAPPAWSDVLARASSPARAPSPARVPSNARVPSPARAPSNARVPSPARAADRALEISPAVQRVPRPFLRRAAAPLGLCAAAAILAISIHVNREPPIPVSAEPPPSAPLQFEANSLPATGPSHDPAAPAADDCGACNAPGACDSALPSHEDPLGVPCPMSKACGGEAEEGDDSSVTCGSECSPMY
jgi:hypothetical protein